MTDILNTTVLEVMPTSNINKLDARSSTAKECTLSWKKRNIQYSLQLKFELYEMAKIE